MGTATQWVIAVIILVPLALAVMTIVLVHKQRPSAPPRPGPARGPEPAGGYTPLSALRNAEMLQQHLREAGERPAP